jgi:hypothetical protein
MEDKYYTTLESVSFIEDRSGVKLHQNTLLNYLRRGKIKAKKVGRNRIFKEHDLEIFCATHKFSMIRKKEDGEVLNKRNDIYTNSELLFMNVCKDISTKG